MELRKPPPVRRLSGDEWVQERPSNGNGHASLPPGERASPQRRRNDRRQQLATKRKQRSDVIANEGAGNSRFAAPCDDVG